jgi:hypothetical protein
MFRSSSVRWKLPGSSHECTHAATIVSYRVSFRLMHSLPMARAAWISCAVGRKSFWIIFQGIEPDDVTGRFYSADPAINRKCGMMEKWVAWLEHRCVEAIRKEGLSTDSKPLSRYVDERWAQKAQADPYNSDR